MHRSLALLFLLLLPVASASHPAAGGSGNDWIEARLLVEIGANLATLRVNATLDLHKAEDVRAGQLRTAYDNGGAQAPAIQAALARLDGALDGSLAAAFPGASRQASPAVLNHTSFAQGARGNALSPPVQVWKEITVTLPAARTGHNYTGAQVEALLAAGARIGVDQRFRAEPGWDATWVLRLPAGWAWYSFASPATAAGRDATARVDAVDSATARLLPATGDARGVVHRPDAPRPAFADERVEAHLLVATPRDGASGLPVAATFTASLHALDVERRLGDALVDRVDLPFLSSDGLRGLLAAGVLRQSHLDSAAEAFRAEVDTRIESALGAPATVTARFEAASLAPGATGPARLRSDANATRPLDGASPALVRAALEAGAVLRANLTLGGLKGAQVTYRIELDGMRYAGLAGATRVDDRTARLILDGRNATNPPTQAVGLRLAHPTATAPSAEDVKVRVTVDLADLETSLSGALSGDYGAVLVRVDARAEIAAVALPEAVRGRLPDGAELPFLSAQGIRALRGADAFGDAEIAELDAEFLAQVRAAVADLAPGAAVTGGLDRATLAGAGPVVLSGQLAFRQNLASGEITPAAAMVLGEIERSFALRAVSDRTTTFDILLPRGLIFTALTAGSAPTSIHDEDGRSVGRIEMAPGTQAEAQATLGATPRLLWEEFPAAVIVGVLVVAGLVALPVWGVARLLRKV